MVAMCPIRAFPPACEALQSRAGRVIIDASRLGKRDRQIRHQSGGQHHPIGKGHGRGHQSDTECREGKDTPNSLHGMAKEADLFQIARFVRAAAAAQRGRWQLSSMKSIRVRLPRARKARGTELPTVFFITHPDVSEYPGLRLAAQRAAEPACTRAVSSPVVMISPINNMHIVGAASDGHV